MSKGTDALRRESIRNGLLAFVSIIVVAGALAFATRRLTSLRAEIAAAEETLVDLTTRIEERRRQIEELAPLAGLGLGYRVVDSIDDAEDLTQSLQAHRTLQQLLGQTPDVGGGVLVRYYPRDFEAAVNEAVVLPALQRASFTLQRMAVADWAQDVPTNAIWVGGDVEPRAAKAVALMLVSAGVEVRTIKQFQDAFGPKRGAIEIGSDVAFREAAVWTVDRIMAADAFPRPN